MDQQNHIGILTTMVAPSQAMLRAIRRIRGGQDAQNQRGRVIMMTRWLRSTV